MPEVSAIDWILLTVLGVSMLVGLWRGLVREVLSLSGWVAAFFVAQWQAGRVADWLPMSGSSDTLRHAAGFVVAFIGVLVLTALLGWLMRTFVSAIGLGLLDRLLGSAFGLVRGVVLLLAVTVVAHMTPWAQTPAWQQARGTVWLDAGLQMLRPMVPAEFGKFLP